MTTERDPRTRIVLSWLREGAHESADRVLLRALDEVDTTPQRRSPWPAWRTNRMDTSAKLAAAVAAALAVAVVGYQFLPVGSGPGGSGPTPPALPAPLVGRAGNGVIALAMDGDIVVADRAGGDLRPLVVGPEHDGSPVFSPDGTRLAFVRSTGPGAGGLMIADADGTNVIQLTAEPRAGSEWSFAPDGHSLVGVALLDGEPHGPACELGNQPKRILIRPVDPAAATVVPDIRLWDSWMEMSQWGGPRYHPTNPQEILVVTQLEPCGPRGIHVYDAGTGEIRTIVEPAGYVHDVAWSPTGDHIWYDLTDETSVTSRVVAADGTGDRALDDEPGTTNHHRVSPWSNDGTRAVISGLDEALVIVSTSGDAEPVKLACGTTMDVGCAPSWIWSPDDSVLIGTSYHEASSADATRLTTSFQQADPDTGQVTELDWIGDGHPSWQRVAS